MPSQTLPPLPKEAFDGVKEKTEISFKRCPHKNVTLNREELRCKCGAAWGGPNIVELYTLLKNQ